MMKNIGNEQKKRQKAAQVGLYVLLSENEAVHGKMGRVGKAKNECLFLFSFLEVLLVSKLPGFSQSISLLILGEKSPWRRII